MPTVFAALLCLPILVPAPAGRPQRPPAALDAYLTGTVHLDDAQRAALLAGRPVTKLLDSDPTKEVAVFGAIWIAAPAGAYIEQVRDIEQFERGGPFRNTRRISTPPVAADFDALSLSPQDLDDLRRCRVGSCDLKLGAEALRQLRDEVHWNTPAAAAEANAMFRRLMLDYVTRYREGGNAALAVYRDKDRPTFVADEFRSMLDRMPPLSPALFDLKRFLLGYPQATLPDADDFFYWQETAFGLKPTIRINHLIVQHRPDYALVASKMLYASHYFWTALETRVLLPDPGRGTGFWLVTVNRSRSDGLAGFVGRFVRGRVRGEVERGTLAALTATKSRLETR
jgi:hypothetical protein